MLSAEMLLNYQYCKIIFISHTNASDKQLGDIMIHNNKPIFFISRIFIKPERNYAPTEKELLAIEECLKQFCGILFEYEINVFSNHTNLVYAATLSEY